MIYEFKGYKPVVDPTAFVHPQAVVTGNVRIGKNVYVGPGAALRGDWGAIIIEDNCNIQENCTLHTFPGATVLLKEKAHIGHGAVIHGALIGYNVLVGINTVVLDNAVIGEESVIGALSCIRADMLIPPRSVVVGNPGRVIKQVSEAMLAWKEEGTQHYIRLAEECRMHLRPCMPLTSAPAYPPQDQNATYKTWNATKNSENY